MPFTFSHPAIVLPLTYLNKKYYSLTGLIIGSLIPDFEYFIRMKVKSNYSHTFTGILWFDLPLGIISAFIFHNIVRNSLFDNLPLLLKKRFISFKNFNWNKHFQYNWLTIIISILIGSYSHLLWDSFTHNNGFFVQNINILTYEFDFLNVRIPLFKILQHFSTLLGSAVIIYAILKLPKNHHATKSISIKYWSFVALFSLVIVVMRVFSENNIHYGNLIVTIIPAILISLILASINRN